MTLSRKLCAAAFAAFLLQSSQSFAGVDEAMKAIGRQDYATARAELQKLENSTDSRVFALLAELNRDGKGGPQDLTEAFADETLAIMYTTDGDARGQFLADRRKVAKSLSDAAIKEGEKRAADAVRRSLGQDELSRQLDTIGRDLEACRQNCDAIAERALHLGPAAAPLVPALESLMTRDPMWMPREWYAVALALIGTEAVPALTRVLLDPEQMKKEGFWNAQQSAYALSLIGPVAYSARPALIEALGRHESNLSGENGDMFSELQGGSTGELNANLKAVIAGALVSIGDPQRKSHDELASLARTEDDPVIKLMAFYVLASTYDEWQDAVTVASHELTSKDPITQKIALALLLDIRAKPGAAAEVEKLAPEFHKLATANDPEVAKLARAALSTLTAQWTETAKDLLRQKKYKEAVEQASTALDRNPWDSETYIVRGEARRAVADVEGALEDYTKALELDPYSVQFLLERIGAIEDSSGEADQATRKALADCIHRESCAQAMRRYK